MNFRTHWLAWRRDVVAFAILCAGAVGLGLVINWTSPRVREALAAVLPSLARHVTIDPDDLEEERDTGPRHEASPWTYHARLTPGQEVWVRNVVGSVSVEPTGGDVVEVRAVKTFGRSDPSAVALLATPSHDGLTVCATSADSTGCGPDARVSHGHGDVVVAFSLHVPRGVRVDIANVNGAVRVRGASAPVTVRVVNGAIDAETTGGPITAVTVNGSIRAEVRGFADTGAVSLSTVNGSLTAELPAHLDAVVNAATLHGRIESAFPVAVSNGLASHRAEGTLGRGGRKVVLHAVNGSIRLLEAPSDQR